MPRKKKKYEVGALVKMYRRKEPGLGMIVERLTQVEVNEKQVTTWQYKKEPDKYACKVKWIKLPSAWEGHMASTSYVPESWLRIVGEVK